jgi:hypothetical protein
MLAFYTLYFTFLSQQTYKVDNVILNLELLLNWS